MNDLRQLIEDINRKYDSRPLPPPRRIPVEEFLPGEEIETAFGRHFETEKLWEHHRHHGSADIGALATLPPDLLSAIASEMPSAAPETWAFLDTETTGLSGGISTCAFLVGVGRITREGFRVRQFFMRGYGEEASLLDGLARHLKNFRALITYNGVAFDRPLLESRYRLNRAPSPFGRLPHLDLLYGARRLWKLRFDSCRLVDLENQVLGVERKGDIPGALIPYVYFEYLRTKWIERLVPVFHHNALDILTLACLTGIVPNAFKDAAGCTNGAELIGIARWLRETGDIDRALPLFRRAMESGLRDELLFRTLWDIAKLDRAAAKEIWTDLGSSKNPYRVKALAELAKHEEHTEKNYAQALKFTRDAMAIRPSPELEKREQRLKTKLKSL
ncbi:MAG: ribonuclease H-like domain-containing protein [Bryobacteraceae bacterium]|jgi:uncharacterized protein YprB with RNaseH-like and TPR domain